MKNVDVIMGHYLSDTRIDQAIKMTKKPIIHTEYAHSLGLAFGDFEAKYDRILREEKVIGGSIWCWSDQTIMTLGDTQKNHILKSVWADSLRFIDSYGRSEVPEGKSRKFGKRQLMELFTVTAIHRRIIFKYERYILRLLSRQKN